MLALIALGVLDRTHAFPAQDLSAETLAGALKLKDETIDYFEELTAPLTQAGRDDLAQLVEEKIAAFREAQKKDVWKRKVIGTLDAEDGRWFNSHLKRVKCFCHL